MPDFSVEGIARKHCLHCWSIAHGVNPGPNECRKDAIAAAVNETLEAAEKICLNAAARWNPYPSENLDIPTQRQQARAQMATELSAALAVLRNTDA